MKEPTVRYRPVIVAGFLIGTGLSALADSIVLERILQWHAPLSGAFPLSGVPPETIVTNARINAFWGGVFQLAAWLVTVLGVGFLWRAGLERDVAWSTRTIGGAALVGWGFTAFTEGVVAHHVLGLHHVHEAAGSAVWDVGYLLIAAAIALAGWKVLRRELPHFGTRASG